MRKNINPQAIKCNDQDALCLRIFLLDIGITK